MEQWVRPLLGLAALSTRSPQRLCWVTLHTHRHEGESGPSGRSGVLFGSGISQEPYQADEPDEWRDPERRPLLTLRDLPLGLPVVLAEWRALEASQNPFLELYPSVLGQPDLPPRARFLYLIQALEGLHAFEHRRGDKKTQRAFEARREAILTDLVSASVAGETLRYIKRNWSRRRIDSLDRRVRDLVAAMPDVARGRADDEMLPLWADLEADGQTRLEQKLQRLRNDISHGSRRFDEEDLEPWVGLLELVARSHLLRLMGIDPERIGALLTGGSRPLN
jgi:hypothetical protein